MNPNIHPFPTSTTQAYLLTARVTEINHTSIRLNNGMTASLALSCLIEPMIDDLVLVCHAGESGCQVIQILARSNTGEVHLRLPQGQALNIQAEQISLISRRKTVIGSAGELEFNALQSLKINASQVLMSVAGTLVQTAKTAIGQFGDLSLSASHLLRLQALRQLITAKKEIKVDSDIIHMG
ncbi:DUF3540 domain-containing protein [Gynuella sp.]|uniref:DUF3540 domain-containing protein n=1 Tax=Gynuella sp. TaxID=2969146 RepID=UPI003D0A128C